MLIHHTLITAFPFAVIPLEVCLFSLLMAPGEEGSSGSSNPDGGSNLAFLNFPYRGDVDVIYSP